jgi:hypothetical protein
VALYHELLFRKLGTYSFRVTAYHCGLNLISSDSFQHKLIPKQTFVVQGATSVLYVYADCWTQNNEISGFHSSRYEDGCLVGCCIL